MAAHIYLGVRFDLLASRCAVRALWTRKRPCVGVTLNVIVEAGLRPRREPVCTHAASERVLVHLAHAQ
jgi:hypothetical protein